MNASNIAKIVSMISAIAVGIAIVGCVVGQPPPPQATAKPVTCNGKPDWCLVVKSDLDADRPAYVYVDGRMQGLILPGKTRSIPVQTGLTHYVHYCAYFHGGEHLQWKCTTPTAIKFDSGDSQLAVLPLE